MDEITLLQDGGPEATPLTPTALRTARAALLEEVRAAVHDSTAASSAPPEPASVLAARQLVTDARERRRLGRRRPTRSRARLGIVLVASAAAAAALVLGLLPGASSPSASAFAGYEYTPTPLSAEEQQAQAEDRRNDMLAQGSGYDDAQRQEIASSTVVAADVRGSWSFTVLTAPDPVNGTMGVFCLRKPR